MAETLLPITLTTATEHLKLARHHLRHLGRLTMDCPRITIEHDSINFYTGRMASSAEILSLMRSVDQELPPAHTYVYAPHVSSTLMPSTRVGDPANSVPDAAFDTTSGAASFLMRLPDVWLSSVSLTSMGSLEVVGHHYNDKLPEARTAIGQVLSDPLNLYHMQLPDQPETHAIGTPTGHDIVFTPFPSSSAS
jgi:hypothetical protein